MADTLNAGRETFRLRGCMGCHRYEGFDHEPEEMTTVNQQIRQLEQQKAEWTREIGFTTDKADRTRDNDEAQRLYQHANDLKVRITGLDAKIEQVDMRASDLIREVKKVGPSLKEVRMKMHKEWIPVWLAGSAQMAARHQDAHLPSGSGRDQGHRRVHLAIRRDRQPAVADRRAIRRKARKPSRRAAAWPATPWARAAKSRAALSPPT